MYLVAIFSETISFFADTIRGWNTNVWSHTQYNIYFPHPPHHIIYGYLSNYKKPWSNSAQLWYDVLMRCKLHKGYDFDLFCIYSMFSTSISCFHSMWNIKWRILLCHYLYPIHPQQRDTRLHQYIWFLIEVSSTIGFAFWKCPSSF